MLSISIHKADYTRVAHRACLQTVWGWMCEQPEYLTAMGLMPDESGWQKFSQPDPRTVELFCFSEATLIGLFQMVWRGTGVYEAHICLPRPADRAAVVNGLRLLRGAFFADVTDALLIYAVLPQAEARRRISRRWARSAGMQELARDVWVITRQQHYVWQNHDHNTEE